MKKQFKYVLIAVCAMAIFTACSSEDVDELTVDVPSYEAPANGADPGRDKGPD